VRWRFRNLVQEEAMPTGLKVVIVLNLIGVVAIVGIAAIAGGGFTSGVFAPDHVPTTRSPALRMSATHGAAASGAPDNPVRRLPEVRGEYWATDPAPRPWDVLPDGSVRFRE
jgi:hypothetical protein